MIRDARLKKDMSYNQNYSKENFSQLQCKLEWISLFYTETAEQGEKWEG